MITQTSLQRDHQYHTTWRVIRLMVLLLVLVMSVLMDVAIGPTNIPLSVLTHALTDHQPLPPSIHVIVFSIRLPVALMAVAVGMALGLSGTIMQTVLNNTLASSYTLGISAGAGFGAALVIVMGSRFAISDSVMVPIAAFLFAALACTLVMLIGHAKGGGTDAFVLAGIALLFMFQALLSLLQYLASPEALQEIVFWLFGSLSKTTWSKLAITSSITFIVFPLLMKDAWALTALNLSDERAKSLGVNLSALRLRSLAIVSLLTGVAVAFVGTIGFIGLIAPHMARALFGEDHRLLLPGAALTGALLLSGASVVGKWVAPGALVPIGIVTALLGVPFFLLLILRSKTTA